jgi:hypothetical protein
MTEYFLFVVGLIVVSFLTILTINSILNDNYLFLLAYIIPYIMGMGALVIGFQSVIPKIIYVIKHEWDIDIQEDKI